MIRSSSDEEVAVKIFTMMSIVNMMLAVDKRNFTDVDARNSNLKTTISGSKKYEMK